MAWGKIDDKLHGHPKFLSVSLAARGLWLTCLSWSCDQLTDGNIPSQVVLLYGGPIGKELADELVSAGLWDSADKGWTIHNYARYNPSAQSVRAEREAAKERMRNNRDKKNSPRSQDVRPNNQRSSPEVRECSDSPVPVPVPVPEPAAAAEVAQPVHPPPAVPSRPAPVPSGGLAAAAAFDLASFQSKKPRDAYLAFRAAFPQEADDMDREIRAAMGTDKEIRVPERYFGKRMIEALSGERPPLPVPAVVPPTKKTAPTRAEWIGE